MRSTPCATGGAGAPKTITGWPRRTRSSAAATPRWTGPKARSFPRRTQRRPEHHPVLHHESHVLQYIDILERIARPCDQVRVRFGCAHPQLCALAEELCGPRGGGLNRLHRCHPELNLAGKFLGDRIGPHEAADVGSESDPDAGAQRPLERVAMDGGARAVAP